LMIIEIKLRFNIVFPLNSLIFLDFIRKISSVKKIKIKSYSIDFATEFSNP
jgi:hypothetical protein